MQFTEKKRTFVTKIEMKEPRLQYYSLGEDVTAFSTSRSGGYSEGRYGEFNINRYCGDSEEAISQNREALCRILGIDDDRLLMPHQVHQTEIAVVDEDLLKLSAEEQVQRLEGVDVLMTNVRGVCIGVSTADCIPVLLCDPVRHAVCAIHAGWRGTVMRIVEKAVTEMTAVYGTCPADIMAQIGPGIHLDSFEVGDEVYDAFAHEGFPMERISKKYLMDKSCSRSNLFALLAKKLFTFHSIPEQSSPTRSLSLLPSKWHIDLPESNRLQLLTAGLRADRIAVSSVCTYQQSDTFFSARRLGIDSGRIFTGILLHQTTKTL